MLRWFKTNKQNFTFYNVEKQTSKLKTFYNVDKETSKLKTFYNVEKQRAN